VKADWSAHEAHVISAFDWPAARFNATAVLSFFHLPTTQTNNFSPSTMFLQRHRR
jgi:hypothetical protein